MKSSLFVLLLLLVVQQLPAQINRSENYLEIGLTTFATNYSGDLAEKHIHFTQTRLGAGLFGRYHLNRFFLVKGQLLAGKLFADDKYGATHYGRHFRFSTTLLEGAVFVEAVLGSIRHDAISRNTTYYFFPYLIAGLGAASVRPSVTYYGPENRRDRFVLEPFPEGGVARHTFAVMPFGLGFRVIAGDYYCVGVEACARAARMDLLDGVSRNANPTEDDWYYTAGLTFSYFLDKPWRPRR